MPFWNTKALAEKYNVGISQIQFYYKYDHSDDDDDDDFIMCDHWLLSSLSTLAADSDIVNNFVMIL